MAAATLTAPFHIEYSGSANLCTSAGIVWLDEAQCSSPKSEHLLILTQNSEGSVGGVLTKPTPSSTETITTTTTTKKPGTSIVLTTLPESDADPTDMAILTTTETTTIPEKTITVSRRALESSPLPKLRTPYTTATVPLYTDYLAKTTSTVYDGSDVLFTELFELLPIKTSPGATSTETLTLPEDLVATKTYVAGDGSTVTEVNVLLPFANSGTSLGARRPLFAWTVILFTIAWLMPMVSATRFDSGHPAPASLLERRKDPVTTATVPIYSDDQMVRLSGLGFDTTVFAFPLDNSAHARTSSGAITTATLTLNEDNLFTASYIPAGGSATVTETDIILPTDYFGAGTSLDPGRSLWASAATLFTIACLMPMASAMPIEPGMISILA